MAPIQNLRGYELEESLGQGGFGAVYRAYQPTVGREVAIKVILPQYANQPEFIRRFEAEAQLIARLEHPHIVPLYDFWRDPEGAYLVMRYIRGGSLRKHLTGKPAELATALSILEQTSLALDVAHRHQVVHCDIKPDNILMDEDGNAYLSDFGIARMMKSDFSGQPVVNEAATLVGSLGYLSPEQARSAVLTQQSDIYSLAIIAFELLTGQHPFQEFSPTTQLLKHLTEPLPLIVNYRSDLPASVDDVIQRATAKKPEERYNTASEFIQSLRYATGSGLLVVQSAPVAPPPPMEMINPYKGLRPFEEADVDDFFGRENLVRKLLERLETPTTLKPSATPREISPYRFLAVVGPSGSGKSSVVKAGLIPALRRGFLPGSSSWLITQMTPGDSPMRQLEDELLQVASRPVTDLQKRLRENSRGLAHILPELFTDSKSEILLVVDQFEEIFTRSTDEAERVLFLESLRNAVTTSDSRLRVIITLRADFYDRPLLYSGFGALMQQRTEVVLPLSPTDLAQAIIGPAERIGVTLERGLPMEIAAEVADQPGALPLLQYALTELFERREGRILTRSAYKSLGGVMGALTRRAEELYNLLDKAGRQAAKVLFQRLVTLGEGTEDTRRRTQRSELDTLSPQVSMVIELYGRARLLSFDRDSITRSPTVEVAHEALIREWHALREWLNENRESIRQQQHLTLTAQNWDSGNRDPGDLYRGARLIQATEWTATHAQELNPLEREFLAASTGQARREEEERLAQQQRELEAAQKLAETEKARAEEQSLAARKLSRRGRYLIAALGLSIVLLVIAAWLGVQANHQRLSAEQNFNRSERLRLAAEASALLLSGADMEAAPLLSLESLKLGYTQEADATLQRAMTFVYPAHILEKFNGIVYAVAFSPDSKYAAVGSLQSAKLFDVESGQMLREFAIGSDLSVSALAFSPDGRLLATGSDDNLIRLWNVESGQQLRALKGQAGYVWSVAFSPDGQELASVGNDDTNLLVWDTASGQEIRKIALPAVTSSVSFSPDGQYLLTGGDDNVARLFNAESGDLLREFHGHKLAVVVVAFSHDGKQIATGSDDKTARIWDTATGQELKRLAGHQESVYGVAFSPDDKYLLTSSYDRIAILWSLERDVIMRKYMGHQGSLYAGSISPDGKWVLTGSADSTARIWPSGLAPDPRQFSHTSSVIGMALSKDGKILLTGTSNGTARLWDTQTGQELRRLSGHKYAIESVDFSPDGKLALTVADDRSMRLWNTQDGRAQKIVTGFNGATWSVHISPDSKTAVTAGEDGLALWSLPDLNKVRTLSDKVMYIAAFSPDGSSILAGGVEGLSIFDAASGALLFEQSLAAENSPYTAVFSPDGQSVAIGGDNGKLSLFTFPALKLVRDFNGHTGSVVSSAFSPDGKLLVSGSHDGSARIWDVASGQQLRVLSSQQALVNSVAFSLDGTQVYIGGADNIVWRWDVDYRALTAYACSVVGHDLTTEEREKYNILDPEPVCGAK
jgi:WD40 repeat protein/serine/threonine protein kinase